MQHFKGTGQGSFDEGSACDKQTQLFRFKSHSGIALLPNPNTFDGLPLQAFLEVAAQCVSTNLFMKSRLNNVSNNELQ